MDKSATHEDLWQYMSARGRQDEVSKRRLITHAFEQEILSKVDNHAAQNDARLSFVELGTPVIGQTVIGLHGFAARGRSLIPALSHLADQGIQVLLPDLLGYGFSPWPAHLTYNVDVHLAALETWLQEVKPSEPFWLVGQSMGVLLALAWAARNPARVRGIVAISGPLFENSSEARRTFAQGDAVAWLMLKIPRIARWLCRRLCGINGPGRRFSTARKMQRALGWMLLHAWGPKNIPNAPSAVIDPETKARLLDALADSWLHSWESLYGSLINCLMEYRPWSDLERLRSAGMPILFLHGDQDTLAPITGVRRAEAYGGWKLQEYAGGTHALCFTHPEALSQQIAHFLSDEPSTSQLNLECERS